MKKESKVNEDSIEQALKNRELIFKLVDDISEPRRARVKEMLEGPLGEAYFTAPASSRTQYHSCFPGGLASHSLNVAKLLYKLVAAWCPGRYERETLSFVSIFHDFGKIGDGKEDFYLPNDSEWHRKQGQLFKINAQIPYLSTTQRTLFLLQRNGIAVSDDEYIAILLGDGQYVDENSSYRMKETKLALLLHMADRWATEIEKNP